MLAIYLILPVALDPGVFSTSYKNETKIKMFVQSRERLVREADNFIALFESTVYTMLDPQHLTILQASTACLRG
jgi:succinate dehydrogenase flavin-adding protein (antitoxin of CptAB toxin-antitoxin module)